MNLDKNLFKADYISESREILDSLDDIAIKATKDIASSAYPQGLFAHDGICAD